MGECRATRRQQPVSAQAHRSDEEQPSAQAGSSAEGSASPQEGRRRRHKAVNYVLLAAEMFGEGREGEATEDDDWSPRAAGVPLTVHDDD